MGLLKQLFRHRSDFPGVGAMGESAEPGTSFAVENVRLTAPSPRGLGAIATAVGVRSEYGMPLEFDLPLGELLTRVPEQFVWPGPHDVNRVLKVSATEIAIGLARGRAELSVARLVALAPDVFRWDRTESDDPRIRLNLQKLLEQVGKSVSVPAPLATSAPGGRASMATAPLRTEMPASDPHSHAPVDVVAAHLPAIGIGKAAPSAGGSLPRESLATQSTARQSVESASTPGPAVGGTIEPGPSIPKAVLAGLANMPPVSEPSLQPQQSTSGKQDPRPIDLRPQIGTGTATTLRAVVLGGKPDPTQGGESAASPILAPEIAPAPGAVPSVILRPAAVTPLSAPVHAAAPPVPQSVAEAAVEPVHAPIPEAPVPPAAPRPGEVNLTALQSLFMTDAALDLVGVAAKAAALPGIHAVLISGTTRATQVGLLPASLDVKVLRDLTEDFASRLGDAGSHPGTAGAVSTTLSREDCTVAIFVRDSVRLTAVLDARGFVAGVRERLARATAYLAGAPSAE